MKVSRSTVGWALAAVLTTLAVRLDGRGDEADRDVIVSGRTGARRVFPGLADRNVAEATLRLRPAGGVGLDLVPDGRGGHAVVTQDGTLGPADPDAVEGLWSSLRMATTVRFVSDPDAVPLGVGEIEVAAGDETWTLALGAESPDGVGVYGGVADERWVVESELAVPLRSAPEAWLLRRLLPVRPGEVEAVRVAGEGELELRADGSWSHRRPGEPELLLSGPAVLARLDRLLGARVHGFVPAGSGPGQPWLTLDLSEGAISVSRAGECPDERVAIDRGPGLRPCVDATVLDPWEVAPLLERRLLPHAEARVLSVRSEGTITRTLRRDARGWAIEWDGPQGRETGPVSPSAVQAWYQQLHETEVEVGEAPPEDARPRPTLRIRTDAGVELEVACLADGGRAWCRRDGGGWLAVRGTLPRLDLDPEQLMDRVLVELEDGEAAALELIPGPGTDGVRTSVHLDLGVWRLDAPDHPEGAGALDEVRLETLLAALTGLRGARVGSAPGPVLRTVRVERTGGAAPLELRVHDGCVVGVGERVARVEPADCSSLSGPLLYDDPLRALLVGASKVEVDVEGEGLVVRRRGEVWEGDPRAVEVVEHLEAVRARGLRQGPSPTPPVHRARITAANGQLRVAEVGEGWARLEALPWYYLLN